MYIALFTEPKFICSEKVKLEGMIKILHFAVRRGFSHVEFTITQFASLCFLPKWEKGHAFALFRFWLYLYGNKIRLKPRKY